MVLNYTCLNIFACKGLKSLWSEEIKMGEKNLKIIKGYAEISEGDNTLPSSPGDTGVLMQKFPDVFCCVQNHLDVPYIWLVVCVPFRNFHVNEIKIKQIWV